MKHRILPSNPLHAPPYYPKSLVGKPIVCSKCGKPGGTQIRVGDHYEHQDTAKCGLPTHRRPIRIVKPPQVKGGYI